MSQLARSLAILLPAQMFGEYVGSYYSGNSLVEFVAAVIALMAITFTVHVFEQWWARRAGRLRPKPVR